MCHNKYLKKAEVYRPTWEDRVYDPRGVVITHVVVSYNRSLQEMQSRGRFFHPRCEFVHGDQPIIRKYPNLRGSVWGDFEMAVNKSEVILDGAGSAIPSIVAIKSQSISGSQQQLGDTVNFES